LKSPDDDEDIIYR